MNRLVRLIAYNLAVIVLILGPSIYQTLSDSPNLHLAAQQTPNIRGLFISPATEFESVDSGGHKDSSITVANYSAQPLTINLSVMQFSVSAYSYNYSFTQPGNNWLTLGITQVQLQPNTNKSIPYSINIPAGTKPGGNYYALLASTTLSTGNIKSTAQAASLLYLTTNGKLVHTGKLLSSSFPHVFFGSQLTFSFNVLDTGNIYSLIYTSGKLHGLTIKPAATPVAHLVMPGKPRTFSGIVEHPFLPGIYRLTYGYTTNGGPSVSEAHLVLYIPPWSIATVLLVLLALNLWHIKKHKK